MKKTVIAVFLSLFLLSSCADRNHQDLIIFHAGSLSVPVLKLNKAFEEANPGVRVLSEAAGSLACARKITELNKPCDIILSADYFVIDNMLIPDYAGWNVRFATNEMVIAYRDQSKLAGVIRADNWPDILLRNDVIYGRSDPDADPCGYRTIFAARLAEKYLGREGLADSLINKNSDYMRPKEVDLISLAQSGVIDYMFQYKSVAVQHGFRYLTLPDEINLSDMALKDHYSEVSYLIPGSEPGHRTEIRGDYICYSGTVLNNAPHKDLAMKYFIFLLSSKGQEILRESGQEPLVPAVTDHYGALPDTLTRYVDSILVAELPNE